MFFLPRNFNSRTHVECDRDLWGNACCQAFQLTHSRGVRRFSTIRLEGLNHFNSRTHVECDNTGEITSRLSKNFNSRTHVECDVGSVGAPPTATHFNSRTHVECNVFCMEKNFRKSISTHALTWSATCVMPLLFLADLFQLTHSRGVRHPKI